MGKINTTLKKQIAAAKKLERNTEVVTHGIAVTKPSLYFEQRELSDVHKAQIMSQLKNSKAGKFVVMKAASAAAFRLAVSYKIQDTRF